MERRLKGDVLAEARENSGRVLVTRERIGEDSARVINEEWEECDVSDPKSVLTPADIFRHLQDEGYPVEYARIPVTDGKAPQLSDIDDIVSQAALADENAALVFSCQGGAGRTTTGMVVGSLLHLRRQRKLTALPTSLLSRLARRRSSNAALGDSSDYEVFDVLRDHAYGEEGDDGAGTSGDEVAEADAVLASIEASLKGGSYAAIQKLCHLLKYGDEAKEVTDVVIDTCGKLKNLRKASSLTGSPGRNGVTHGVGGTNPSRERARRSRTGLSTWSGTLCSSPLRLGWTLTTTGRGGARSTSGSTAGLT